MTHIEEVLQRKEYQFLRTDPRLNKNIIFIGFGGSFAYGTQTETSDIDIRGIAVNSKREILTGHGFEQVIDNATDTTIYSFNKIISLLTNCNPNVIEMLGLRKEDYLVLSPIAEELLQNRKMFLSKKAVQSFGGYATAQLRRLDNKTVRDVEQARREQHILNSIKTAFPSMREHFASFPNDAIKLYIDKSEQEDYDTEIFMDVNLTHYPLRDYKSLWSEMNNIVKDYAKLGKRNKNAATHNKLGKHMMHLIRLYLMCLDILEKEEICTYREKEHDMLMEIRNGKYLQKIESPNVPEGQNEEVRPEFYELVDEFERKVKEAAKNTSLTEHPDYKKIQDFVADVNERIVKGE